VLVLLAAAILTACTVFTFSANDLKGKTLTYFVVLGGTSMSSNGHDFMTLVFDSSGAAGTFEMAGFTNDFATQAAVTSGKYTDKTWFQDQGYKGTFTYDAKARKFGPTVTTVLYPNSTASRMTNGNYAAADYSYQDVKVMFAPATSASLTMSANYEINQDSLYYVYMPGSAANSWVSTTVQTMTTTMSGVTSTSTTTSSDTLTVASGSLTEDFQTVLTTSGSTTTTSNSEDTYSYSILKQFLIGSEDKTSETFADVWKKGNSVSFQVAQTEYDEIQWSTAKPAAPTVNATTGNGVTGTRFTPPYYYIDKASSSTSTFNLTNTGDYIMFTDQAGSAYRGIARH
jgi:hypothetical protein